MLTPFDSGVLSIAYVCIQVHCQVLQTLFFSSITFSNCFPNHMLHRRPDGFIKAGIGLTMNQPLHQNTASVAAVQSRIHRLFTIQELFLEYGLALIVLRCFILVSLSSKIVGKFRALEVGVSWIWTQQ